MRAVHYSNESGSPPSGAYDVSCHDESHEVCQERVVDQGNGYGEVVQDCHDETQQYCSYTVDEWETIQTYTLEGEDSARCMRSRASPRASAWGTKRSTYTVVFNTESGQKRYSPSDAGGILPVQIGSSWTLSLNAVGAILDVKP